MLWQGQRYPVARVESRWRTPEGPAFFVEAESGERFELRYHEGRDCWLIQALTERDRSGVRQAKVLPFSPHAVRPSRPKNTDEEVQD